MTRNPFQDVYDICNRQDSQGKMESLPKWPRMVDVEPTNNCNFKCLFCPTGTGFSKRPKGYMAQETFDSLLQEAAEAQLPLRFIGWGEPLLHPSILDWIEKSAKAGLLTHLTTNGSLMTEDVMRRLLNIPLDSIKFSFQGVDRESYREMRGQDRFDALMETIARFRALRGDAERPYIHVSTTITYEDSERVAAFRKRIAPVCDSHHVGRTVLEHLDPYETDLSGESLERLKRLKQAQSVVKEHAECHQVFDCLTVQWDGSISACCRDFGAQMIVGNLSDGTLAEAWHSKRLGVFRKVLAAMGHDALPLCSTCYDMNQLRLPGVQKL